MLKRKEFWKLNVYEAREAIKNVSNSASYFKPTTQPKKKIIIVSFLVDLLRRSKKR